MDNIYKNAMTETMYYLQGIRDEDLNKIPISLIAFLEDNSNKDYICNFDYNKPLNQLDLLDETKGIIAMICLNYWCETQNQKNEFINKLNENEKKYINELNKKYPTDNLFKDKQNKKEKITETMLDMVEYKKPKWYSRIFTKILKIIKREDI